MTPVAVRSVIGRLRQSLRAGAITSAPDQELLERFVRRRDETAFEALLRRHGPMVWGVCQRLLAHRQDTEDAFQATFLVLARKAAAVARRELLANWLFGVARRSALKARAMRARRSQHEQVRSEVPDVRATPETAWEGSAVLDEELAKLPDKYRLPLLLCALEGMTHAEAARDLGWPTGTVAGRLSRGRNLLRDRLLRRGVGVPAAMLTTLLAQASASAAVPPPLITATVRNATALATAGASGAAVVSANVTTLVDGVLKRMFLARLLTTTAFSAALALTLIGAGAIWHWTTSMAPNLASPEWSHWPAVVHAAPARDPAAVNNRGKPSLRLPDDPAAIVCRLERFAGTGEGPRITVTIHADGRVIAEVPDGDPRDKRVNVLEGKLSAQDLQDLVRFALHDQELFDFDPAEVKAALGGVIIRRKGSWSWPSAAIGPDRIL